MKIKKKHIKQTTSRRSGLAIRRRSFWTVFGTALLLPLLAVQLVSLFSESPNASAATCGSATNFITTWKTDNPGTSNSTSITIPTTGGGYNYSVDWNNDGTMDESNIAGDATHDFGATGTYTIQICGSFPRIYSSGDAQKILRVEQWGDNAWTSMERAFLGASNMDVTATDTPNLSNVTSTSSMFGGASSLTGNSSFNSWDVSNVTDMSSMFDGAESFNQPIGNWDVSSVTTMETMFEEASAFNQPLDNWDVSNVQTLYYMFSLASAFNQPLNDWNTSNVTDTAGMFYQATSFNQPIDSWDMSNVVDMYWMFYGASSFNQPLNNWDVSSAVEMGVMFYQATSFNQPLDHWNVSNVATMSYMFNSATSFNQSLGSWNVSSVTDMSGMFDGAPAFSTANYDATLEGWSAHTLQSGVTLDATGNNFCTAEAARQSIIDTYGWTINDAGQACLYIDTANGLVVKDINGQPLDNRGLPGAGEMDIRTVRLLSGTLPLAEATAVFTADLDWTNVTGEVDLAAHKSVVSGLASAPGVTGTHTLYVPKAAKHNAVIICEGAVTLADVTKSCPGGKQLTAMNNNVSIVVIGGVTYWKVDGLSGTGGMSIIASDTQGDPAAPNAPQSGVSNETTATAVFTGTLLVLVVVGLAGGRIVHKQQ
ncbi:MAG TPA: BspA family leucine-rich repeat surface protein [Candidatus Saccharimonadales bacterium]